MIGSKPEDSQALTIGPDWQPTADNINALPTPLKKYVIALATKCDPAGIVAQNVLVMDQNDQLRELLKRPTLSTDDIDALADKHLKYQIEGREVSGVYEFARAIEGARNWQP